MITIFLSALSQVEEHIEMSSSIFWPVQGRPRLDHQNIELSLLKFNLKSCKSDLRKFSIKKIKSNTNIYLYVEKEMTTLYLNSVLRSVMRII